MTMEIARHEDNSIVMVGLDGTYSPVYLELKDPIKYDEKLKLKFRGIEEGLGVNLFA